MRAGGSSSLPSLSSSVPSVSNSLCCLPPQASAVSLPCPSFLMCPSLCHLPSAIFPASLLVFCNSYRCGLYYKLHGSVRLISMKSNITRKCSCHDTRAPHSSLTEAISASNMPSELPFQAQTSSASQNISRRPTPSPSPILAPDSTTQPVAVASHTMSAGIGSSVGMAGTGMGVGGSSELMGALGDTYPVRRVMVRFDAVVFRRYRHCCILHPCRGFTYFKNARWEDDWVTN
jgi:hypothetical protein